MPTYTARWVSISWVADLASSRVSDWSTVGPAPVAAHPLTAARRHVLNAQRQARPLREITRDISQMCAQYGWLGETSSGRAKHGEKDKISTNFLSMDSATRYPSPLPPITWALG